MNNQSTFSTRNALLLALQSMLISTLLTACGGGSSGGKVHDASNTKTATLGVSLTNVELQAGTESEITFTYTIPGDISKRGDFSIDVGATLANMTLSSDSIAQAEPNQFENFSMIAKYLMSALVQEAFAVDGASTAQVRAHLSFAGDPNVCDSDTVFGPYSITGMVGSTLSSDTETVSPTPAAVNIINAGSFEVCLVTTPPIDAFVTLTGIVVDFENCEPATVDVIGDWSGTYSCENYGVVNTGGDVELTITKNEDGSYRYIDDGGAIYDGHVCGSAFKFKGGEAGLYTESGTMTFTSATQASKTSNWQGTAGFNGGSCSDSLSKNPG